MSDTSFNIKLQNPTTTSSVFGHCLFLAVFGSCTLSRATASHWESSSFSAFPLSNNGRNNYVCTARHALHVQKHTISNITTQDSFQLVVHVVHQMAAVPQQLQCFASGNPALIHITINKCKLLRKPPRQYIQEPTSHPSFTRSATSL